MFQAQFAAAFGLELDAIRNWEQGRRRPEGAARAYLKVIEREPEAVRRALVAASVVARCARGRRDVSDRL
jgi:putative transcriptional regulator